MKPGDLAREAVSGIVQRPGRSLLTALGTVLGVGAFVAILGLTSTASSQISTQFNVLRATTVTVSGASTDSSDSGAGTDTSPFPADADSRVALLNGVAAGGVWWQVNFGDTPVIADSPTVAAGTVGDIGGTTSVFAATPGLLAAIQPTLQQGVLFNSFHQQRGEQVCLLGAAVAHELGITALDTQPAVFIDGTAFSVVGIVSQTQQLPETLLGIIVPTTTANAVFGKDDGADNAQMLIRTRVGAATLVAQQAPLALSPTDPQSLLATPPPDPTSLHSGVSGDLTGLFLLLAALSLVIGTVGIANTTFVSVLERTGEIGLRRALGARSRHVAIQFMTESTALGLLGGLAGTACAVVAVLATSVAEQWTAVLDPMTVLPAPLLGAATGLLAGAYPALRAAAIEPVEALRR